MTDERKQYGIEFYDRDIQKWADAFATWLSEEDRHERAREIQAIYGAILGELNGDYNTVHGFVHLYVNREARRMMEERWGKPRASRQQTIRGSATGLDNSPKWTKLLSKIDRGHILRKK